MTKPDKKAALKVILPFVSVMLLLVLAGIYAINEYGAIWRDGQSFKAFLDNYGSFSAVVFTLFQALQVVIAFIPGEPVQIAGGYAFGTAWGTIFSVVGTTLGAVIAFFLARKLGNAVVNLFAKPEKVEKFRSLIDSKNGHIITFIIFLIPGIPKDLLVYVAGITPINPLHFFVIYTIARIPGNLGSSYMGASIDAGNIKAFIIVGIIAVAFLILGGIYHDRIIKWLNSIKGKE